MLSLAPGERPDLTGIRLPARFDYISFAFRTQVKTRSVHSYAVDRLPLFG